MQVALCQLLLAMNMHIHRRLANSIDDINHMRNLRVDPEMDARHIGRNLRREMQMHDKQAKRMRMMEEMEELK